MIVHELGGCAPTPLAHYLKALGVLRLVAEQVDAEARAWWEGERFFLASRLDREELEAFLLNRYEPTPIVAPWNRGSGFFYPDDPGITPLRASTADRFSRIRRGIDAAFAPLDAIATADQRVREIKNESNTLKDPVRKKALRASEDYRKRLAAAEKHFKSLKGELIPWLRQNWRGAHQEWMDAAMVLNSDGEPQYPALLGTGGADGRFDFTNNFLQRLGDLFDLESPLGSPKRGTEDRIRTSLWGDVTRSFGIGLAAGQYLPGTAGGANNSNGPNADSGINAADFVLMFEGVVLLAAHATRRLGTTNASRAAAPFVVRGHGAGYSSSGELDEYSVRKGQRNPGRGEQWMPLWSQPLALTELRRLLAEGRAQIGIRTAEDPMDLARAVARLGTARGITAFQRYAYLQRNGESTLTVPIGRFRVPEKSSARLDCLNDLEVWLPKLRLQARDTKTRKVPASVKRAERKLAEDLFAVVQHPDDALRWQSVLTSLAGVEAVMKTGAGIRAGPIPKLRPEWVSASDDGSPEFRLALSFALQATGFTKDGRAFQRIRRHWLSLDGSHFAMTGASSQRRLRVGPEVVMQGRCGADDAIALLERRLIEAAQKGQRRLPLQAAPRAPAAAGDLALLVAGQVDLDRVLALARALMALDIAEWLASNMRPKPASRGEVPDDAWLAVRLALLPWPLRDGRRIGADPAILRRLASGDAASAVELALRRLRAAGVRTALRAGATDPIAAYRWAAALAFPITQTTAANFLNRIELKSPENPNDR